VDPKQGRATVRALEEALEGDGQIQVAPCPQPPRPEGVEPREPALAQVEPGRRVRADHRVGIPFGGDRDPAVVLVELDSPAQAEIVELDPIAGVEPWVGTEVALVERGESLIHLFQPLSLGSDLSQGPASVPPRTVVPAHVPSLNRLLAEYAYTERE
jgi:hypothetical protein